MQKILGYMRKAIQEFELISDGDVIAVGISGGKDSLVLAQGLYALRKFIGINYNIIGITIDPQFEGKKGNYGAVADMFNKIQIDYHIISTQIGEIVFEKRKEDNPCSLCSRMRRGALCQAAEDLGCNKIALGHNFNDSVETFIMNLFNEGRIGCFSPLTEISDKLTIIRPLVLAPEREVKKAAVKNNFPVVKSVCPADGHTNREHTKEFIRNMEKESKGFSDRIMGAMRRSNIDGWGGKQNK
ncbi:MAG: tRNA 2-thiocytidine biosynthesis protein TtcA [Oscillospiraceae bacterium]|nr:tRNA 2-thiocytidine biosynthesis protein TtcA [Oscillospiraceae bacterium]